LLRKQGYEANGIRGRRIARFAGRVKKGGQLFIKKAASHRSVSPDDKLSVQVWKLFLRFRKTVWFRVTYLVLLGLIVPNLLPFSAGGLGCLVIILVPLAVFLVPYYLGERSVRRFALNALPVILIAILIGGALSTRFPSPAPRAPS